MPHGAMGGFSLSLSRNDGAGVQVIGRSVHAEKLTRNTPSPALVTRAVLNTGAPTTGRGAMRPTGQRLGLRPLALNICGGLAGPLRPAGHCAAGGGGERPENLFSQLEKL